MSKPLKSIVATVGIFLGLCWSSPPAAAAIIPAASASYTDVNAAVISASNGDTVQVPSGTATWSSTLNVGTKAISIIGAGSGNTIITNNVGTLFEFARTGTTSLVRLSGFRFNSDWTHEPVISLVGPISKVRIDHCIFDKAATAIISNYIGKNADGPVYGVVDHCQFINMGSHGAYFAMDIRRGESSQSPHFGQTSWQEWQASPNIAGTTKMLYFEDCIFTYNSAMASCTNYDATIYGQYGGRVCIRYSTFTGYVMNYLDAHGDTPEWSTLFYEIYNNTFAAGPYGGANNWAQGKLGYPRGGMQVIHDNTFTGGKQPVAMTVYWTSDVHRINNTYFWGNTRDGDTNQANVAGIEDSDEGCSPCIAGACSNGETCGGYSAANIVLNQHYFLHAPTTGQTFYPYTPLTYPHPLIPTGTPSPTPTATATATASPAPTATATATAAAGDCSFASVQAAVNAAAPGATVLIPAGNCTWSSTLNITKAITLQGAGSGSTVITSGLGPGTPYGDNPLIMITLPSDISVRVTGIGFQLGAMDNAKIAITVLGNRTGSFAATKVRLDHLAITGGGGHDDEGTIFTSGWVDGLIDHNTFRNTYCGVYSRGDDNYAWIRARNNGILAGTADALFIEDNTFILDNNSSIVVDAEIYIQEGANTVVRYNTFDSTAFTNVDFMTLIFNHHGNVDYYTGGTDFRGQPISEAYNNIAHVYQTNQFMVFRGGSNLIHDNVFTSVVGGAHPVELWEEEAWLSVIFSPLRTAWPAQDQVFNSFFWNNTYNGNTVNSVSFGDPTDTTFIQQNRDYFMHAPQSSGGKETFTGSRWGGSTTAPTTTDTGTMTFSSSGANAYYPYTPYIYPHPLAGGTPAPTPTPSSSSTPAPTSTPTSTATATPTSTATPAPTSSPLGLSFDASTGIITAPFTVSASGVSQSIETDDPTQGGRASYTFNVPVSGDYLLSALVNCPDASSNSFFVNLDAEPSVNMVWHVVPVTSGPELRIASWPPNTTPKVWTLNAGAHQLIVRGREANALLQHITFSIPPQAPQGLHVVP